MNYDKTNEQGEVRMIKAKAVIVYRRKSDFRRTQVILLILLTIQLVRNEMSNLLLKSFFFQGLLCIRSYSTIYRYDQLQSFTSQSCYRTVSSFDRSGSCR